MKYTYDWLKDYYKTEGSVEETAELITSLGSEVDEIISDKGIVEVEITPNRGDLLSHFGMARDLSAKAGKLINKPEIDIKEVDKKTSDAIKVEVKSEQCSLYIARVIKGVKVKESPGWLKDRLISCGINPVNNIVDVTNYVMLDLGHPLHAFDANKLQGGQIVVDEIKNEQEVMCLDDKGRAILSGMLCICDTENPIAIAGVMGLKCSEVDESTQDIVLEAAVFNPRAVRKTAKLLNIKTEASYRFERGVDDRGTSYAINKASQMITELAGGEILSGEVVAGKVAKQSNVKIEYDKANELIGHKYSKDQTNKVLESLGFEINEDYAYVPSWRHDISIWQDLAEEVARLEGLDKIKPEVLEAKNRVASGDYYKKEKIKDILVELGLDEAITYTFLSEADIKTAKLEAENLLEVANPVQIENRYLRNSLIPGLLKVISKAPSFDNVEIFEMGRVFNKEDEWESLAIVTSGKSSRKANKIVEQLSKKLQIDRDVFNVYEIERDDLKRFKIKKPTVWVSEVEVKKLLKSAKFPDLNIKDDFKQIIYRPISKYPPVSRDLAFVVDSKYTLGEIKSIILEASPAVVLTEPFDEFVDDRFGKDKKSVAFHLHLQKMSGTLSDQDADQEVSNIIEKLEQDLGAKLRK